MFPSLKWNLNDTTKTGNSIFIKNLITVSSDERNLEEEALTRLEFSSNHMIKICESFYDTSELIQYARRRRRKSFMDKVNYFSII